MRHFLRPNSSQMVGSSERWRRKKCAKVHSKFMVTKVIVLIKKIHTTCGIRARLRKTLSPKTNRSNLKLVSSVNYWLLRCLGFNYERRSLFSIELRFSDFCWQGCGSVTTADRVAVQRQLTVNTATHVFSLQHIFSVQNVVLSNYFIEKISKYCLYRFNWG